MGKPLCVDLYCGLGGWTEGFLSEGFDVVGFDIERHVYGDQRYPAQLVLQDVLTLHGSQFREARCIVASPPCQFFSYCAMPWSRAKELARVTRENPELLAKELELFEACFRIQREACEAAGHHIPMVVENVKGAQKWVGRAQWSFGSYYLWGDVPALMPIRRLLENKQPVWFNDDKHGRKCGGDWFGSGMDCSLMRRMSSKSRARKAASAQIAKIPFALAQHLARVFKPAATAA